MAWDGTISGGDYQGAQLFGTPWMDEAQRRKMLITPPLFGGDPRIQSAPAAPPEVGSTDFTNNAVARQASDSGAPAARSATPPNAADPIRSGAQTADMNAINLPEPAARSVRPEDRNFGTGGEAINALMTPRQATPEDRYNDWQSRAPQRADYQPQKHSLLKNIAGAVGVGMLGYRDPHLGFEAANRFREAPEKEAAGRFNQANEQWEREGKGIVQGAQLAREEGTAAREATNSKSENELRAAQTDMERQRLADAKDRPDKPEDKKIDEGFNANNQRVHIYQRPNGETYTKVFPDIVQKGSDGDKTAAEKSEIIAQIGERPKPGQKNSKGLTEDQWGKQYEKHVNAQAAAGASARGEAYGANRPMQVLDTWNGNRPVVVSAKEAEENPSRYVTQSGGEKSLPREALINDIRVSAQKVQKNLAVLDKSGADRVKLAAALADPTTTAEAYLQAIPRGSLDEDSQQFVADLFNLREQAMAMRSVLGGVGGAEDARRAILQTLPNIASNSKLGKKQLDNLTGVLDRIERGVPKVPLRGEGGTQYTHTATNPKTGEKQGFNEQTGKWEKILKPQ